MLSPSSVQIATRRTQRPCTWSPPPSFNSSRSDAAVVLKTSAPGRPAAISQAAGSRSLCARACQGLSGQNSQVLDDRHFLGIYFLCRVRHTGRGLWHFISILEIFDVHWNLQPSFFHLQLVESYRGVLVVKYMRPGSLDHLASDLCP